MTSTLREKALAAKDVHVRFSDMLESNGRVTWFVYLARTPDASIFDCHQVYASTIKGRAEYERDALLHFLGQGPQPDILSYETDAPIAALSTGGEKKREFPIRRQSSSICNAYTA